VRGLRISRRDLIGAAAATATVLRLSPALALTGIADPRTAGYDAMLNDFLRRLAPPGGALAVSKDGRLVYARGFGLADVARRQDVEPTSLFRIASLSKPFTATAVMQLVEAGRLKLDDKVFRVIKLQPFLARGARLDQRIDEVTVLNCLQHTGGWDRDKGFDPMGAGAAEQVAHAMGIRLPIRPEHIIRYTMGLPLNFDPGSNYAYSNFGYCVLGRVIEAASGLPYADYVARNVLRPIGIDGMRQGKNLLRDRAPGEVVYYDGKGETGRAISGPNIGQQVPLPYGWECIETMDANGGWIASAIELVRFGDAFNDIKASKLLNEASIRTMLARPLGPPGLDKGRPGPVFYGCGWQVRPANERIGRWTKWHFGMLRGSSTLLVCRDDGLNWAAVFNSDATRAGKEFSGEIDGLLHQVANQMKDWPDGDLYKNYMI
jgi:CubicO group peptidase (beta-lactamase class C family)